MARYNYSTKQCAVCGCDIRNAGSSKYCISCGIEVRQMRQRKKYQERMELKNRLAFRQITHKHYLSMAAVFKRFGYDMPSWKKYAAKHVIKEVQ